jgi:hypothetical protein
VVPVLSVTNHPNREDESPDLIDGKPSGCYDVELDIVKVDWGADPVAGVVV